MTEETPILLTPKRNRVFFAWLYDPICRSAVVPVGAIRVIAALCAYHNSFPAFFVSDDKSAIADNLSIRHGAGSWSPPPSATTRGRPLLNFTFALNYALGGMDVTGYHV